jgi:large conductance mechanosensitive channel
VEVIREFRGFILRGNLVELAVAFVLGPAFAGARELPIVAMIFGQPDFSGLDFTINDADFRSAPS